MDWPNEEYVRLYTRETADDLDLSWEAVALWRAMLTKFDRAGLLVARNGWLSVSRLVRIPAEVVERAGLELVKDGRIKKVEGGFFAPNYVEAQTASKSDKARQRESRDRRREKAASQVIESSEACHRVSHAVTSSHEPSQNVTLCSALLCDSAAESAPAPPPLVLISESEKPKTDQQQLTDSYFSRFEKAYGTKPTWSDKQAGQLAQLLKKHSASELESRLDVMFGGKVDWPKPPYTFDTFVSNIDRWVVAPKRKQIFPKMNKL